MRAVITSTLLMYGLWLALSGHYTPLLLVIGFFCALGVSLISYRMGVLDEEGLPMDILLRLPRITLWLVREILTSNWRVVKLIVNPAPIAPEMRWISAAQKSKAALVTHANFITLTPGTVSIDVSEVRNEILVHGLTNDFFSEDMMNQGVNRLERD